MNPDLLLIKLHVSGMDDIGSKTKLHVFRSMERKATYNMYNKNSLCDYRTKPSNEGGKWGNSSVGPSYGYSGKLRGKMRTVE